MSPSLASTFTFGLLLSLAGQSLAVPTPASGTDEAASLAKRQNAPAFGGWDQGENVTALIQELSEQVNPIDRDVLLPADGFVFDFLGEWTGARFRSVQVLADPSQTPRALAAVAKTAASSSLTTPSSPVSSVTDCPGSLGSSV